MVWCASFRGSQEEHWPGSAARSVHAPPRPPGQGRWGQAAERHPLQHKIHACAACQQPCVAYCRQHSFCKTLETALQRDAGDALPPCITACAPHWLRLRMQARPSHRGRKMWECRPLPTQAGWVCAAFSRCHAAFCARRCSSCRKAGVAPGCFRKKKKCSATMRWAALPRHHRCARLPGRCLPRRSRHTYVWLPTLSARTPPPCQQLVQPDDCCLCCAYHHAAVLRLRHLFDQLLIWVRGSDHSTMLSPLAGSPVRCNALARGRLLTLLPKHERHLCIVLGMPAGESSCGAARSCA